MEISIDTEMALRFAGVRGSPEPELLAMAHSCAGEINSSCSPRHISMRYAVERQENGLGLVGTVLTMPGKDIERHLAGCGECILLAATLGAEADALIRRAQVRDMTRAVILDAVASAAVEALCDRLEEDFRKAYGTITARFSPGYGDLPIELQRTLLEVLEAPRLIGLHAAESFMLTPTKSVTAIIGIGNT